MNKITFSDSSTELPKQQQQQQQLPKQNVSPTPENSENNEWQIKPRTYLLKGNKRPLSKMIRSAGIYYFVNINVF